MIVRSSAGLAALLLLFDVHAPAQLSPSAPAAVSSSQTAGAPRSPSPPDAAAQSAGAAADCNGVPCDQKQLIVTLPKQPQQPWLVRDRIAWGAYLVLALAGYAGILLAISALKKIERNTAAAETTARAAAEAAEAALALAQSILHSQRPWVLVSVEPSIGKPNSFDIVATNKGSAPAAIVDTLEQAGIKSDESHLPEVPEYGERQDEAPRIPVTLVPGESTLLKTFSRDDVLAICGSEERFKRIENWDEKLFLHGRVLYRDLLAPSNSSSHQTDWCCWYIHGRQKSGMVIAGPPGYNAHN